MIKLSGLLINASGTSAKENSASFSPITKNHRTIANKREKNFNTLFFKKIFFSRSINLGYPFIMWCLNEKSCSGQIRM
jgi:hypothetical protein